MFKFSLFPSKSEGRPIRISLAVDMLVGLMIISSLGFPCGVSSLLRRGKVLGPASVGSVSICPRVGGLYVRMSKRLENRGESGGCSNKTVNWGSGSSSGPTGVP